MELASRAGVTQSVISAYESGARQPSLPMLARLARATGHDLDVQFRKSSQGRLQGALGQRVRAHRADIEGLAGEYGVSNLRVFGSVARGEDTAVSGIDLLVDEPPHMGLLQLARLRFEFTALGHSGAGACEDLKPVVAGHVGADAVAL